MWVRLAEAAVRQLEATQFEAVGLRRAQAILQGRKLGVARLRLLPKRTGAAVAGLLGRRCHAMQRDCSNAKR